ncbi:hypothetical protein MY11210_003300 [Beauveria gryllotalpidicola]
MSILALPSSNTGAEPDEEDISIALAKQAVDYSDGCEDVVRARAYIQLGCSYWACNMWKKASKAMQQDVWTTREEAQLSQCQCKLASAAGEKE